MLHLLKSKLTATGFILTLPVLTSCSTISGLWKSDSVKSEESGNSEKSRTNTSISSSVSDVELKQARIWNRLDDLEDEVKSQRERIKLLEQGLLTGIPPEELKRPAAHKSKKVTMKENGKGVDVKSNVPNSKMVLQNSAGNDEAADEPSMKPVLDLPDQVTDVQSAEDSPASAPDSYRVRIQVAKDYYQASRFGMAVAELAQITREFGPAAGNGEAKYWLGRSYLGLKEFATSKVELEGFIAQYPQSEFVPNARLELGRCLLGLNLRDRARKEFAKIAKDYEGQDPGDIASAELRNLKGNL